MLLVLLASAAFGQYVPGELLVRFKPGVATSSESAVHAKHKARVLRKIAKARVQRVKLPPGLSVEQAVRLYKQNPNVEYVGPNHTLTLDLMPNDEYFEMWQWGLYSGDTSRADIHAPEAWGITTGSNTVIAIIDTGVWADHEDLKVTGPNPKVLTGYNAVHDNSDTTDLNGHGTFSAGLAAAITNNSLGIAGVAWNARILPIKVIEGETGSEYDAAAGIYWAVDHGAKILNMSFGGYLDVPELHNAIDYAWNHGCISVCSSGNDSLNTMHYPSAYDHALAVGGTDEYNHRWVYDDPFTGQQGGSNYGSWLDVMAPANWIIGCYSQYDELFGLGYYTLAMGTSASAPLVSGTAALIWSQHPTWTNQRVVEQIIASCDDIGAPGWDIETGAGRINAYQALSMVRNEPATIMQLKSLPNGAWVSVTGRVVTSKPGRITDRIYLEDDKKTSGILVYAAQNPPTMVEGSRVDVTGNLSEHDGERAIINAVFSSVTTGAELKPAWLAGLSVGGGAQGYQPGVEQGFGLNNLGLLATCSGVVTKKDFAYFYIDDGSGLDDSSGYDGLRVEWGGTKNFVVGNYVTVTGIVGCEIPAGSTLRVRNLRVRQLSDIVKIR